MATHFEPTPRWVGYAVLLWGCDGWDGLPEWGGELASHLPAPFEVAVTGWRGGVGGCVCGREGRVWRAVGNAVRAPRCCGCGQSKGTASAGEVCQLVTIGLSTVMVSTGRETGLESSSPMATMMLSSSLPPSVLVVFGFTPA